MKTINALPAFARHAEPWANGAGSTTIILREPDSNDWRIRVSIARVEHAGPFSDLPDTRRWLVPLDVPMALHFNDGRELHAERFGVLSFAGSPPPSGSLPDGVTRDFNLMLRGDVRGELFARTLVDTMVLPHEPGARWLVYLNSGRATLRADMESLTLNVDDAAFIGFGETDPARAVIEGGGEIVLAKLYA